MLIFLFLSVCIPDEWRRVVVTLLLNNDTLARTSNYRSIRLTSVLCKVLERIVKDSIMGHLRRKQFLHDASHGFVTGRLCLTNLISMLNMVPQLLDNENNVDIWFPYFSKTLIITGLSVQSWLGLTFSGKFLVPSLHWRYCLYGCNPPHWRLPRLCDWPIIISRYDEWSFSPSPTFLPNFW